MRQGAPGCLSVCSRKPGSAHMSSSRWIKQAWFPRSEDFPSYTDLRPSPQASAKKLLSLLALLLLLYWCLFTLDISGLFLEPKQTNWEKKITKYSCDLSWRWSAAWVSLNLTIHGIYIVSSEEKGTGINTAFWRAHNLNLTAKSLSVAVSQVAS